MAHLITKFCTRSGICGEFSSRMDGTGDLVIQGTYSGAQEQLRQILTETGLAFDFRLNRIEANPNDARLRFLDHEEIQILLSKLVILCL